MGLKNVALGLAAVVLASSTLARGAIIVQYSAVGASGTAGNQPASLTATAASDPNVTASTLTRGPGIVSAALANGFSANSWDTGTTSLALAETANEFFQWAFTVETDYTASIDSFDATLRRSAVAAPSHFALEYSFDGFATAGVVAVTFNYLGRDSGTAPTTITPFQWMTTDTPGQAAGNRISTQDLSGVAALQDLAAGTTVTFRLYGWGDGSGAASNTVALGRNPAVDNGNGQAGAQINGTVALVPEPASIALAVIGGGVLAVRRARRRD
jgi:hypothetical protein